MDLMGPSAFFGPEMAEGSLGTHRDLESEADFFMKKSAIGGVPAAAQAGTPNSDICSQDCSRKSELDDQERLWEKVRHLYSKRASLSRSRLRSLVEELMELAETTSEESERLEKENLGLRNSLVGGKSPEELDLVASLTSSPVSQNFSGFMEKVLPEDWVTPFDEDFARSPPLEAPEVRNILDSFDSLGSLMEADGQNLAAAKECVSDCSLESKSPLNPTDGLTECLSCEAATQTQEEEEEDLSRRSFCPLSRMALVVFIEEWTISASGSVVTAPASLIFQSTVEYVDKLQSKGFRKTQDLLEKDLKEFLPYCGVAVEGLDEKPDGATSASDSFCKTQLE